jgi:hypothetical protein
MRSWDSLPDALLGPAGQVTEEFIKLRLREYRGAARYLNQLSYGRNSSRTDLLGVLRESRGTCSTKHALLKLLAMEQQIEIALVVGIYEMSERNTPGVGRVLAKYSLGCVPEAHCYLRYHGIRIDVTRALAEAPAEPIVHFLYEEEITPPQVGEYKVHLHQDFIRRWLAQRRNVVGYDYDEIWRIREQCIAALSA